MGKGGRALEWTDFASTPAESLRVPPVSFMSETTKQCYLQNILVPAATAWSPSQDASGILDATGQPDANRKCTHI